MRRLILISLFALLATSEAFAHDHADQSVDIDALNPAVPVVNFTQEDTRKLCWAALEIGKLIEREISYRANQSDDPIPLTAGPVTPASSVRRSASTKVIPSAAANASSLATLASPTMLNWSWRARRGSAY